MLSKSKFYKILNKFISSIILVVILLGTTGIANIAIAADYLVLKGTVITGANYNQPLGTYYQERVAIGTTKYTGVEQTWSVETGMHEYSYDRRSLNPVIPINKWVAQQFENENNSQGACIHGWIKEWRVGDNYFTWSANPCGKRTIPAWSAYCADCGQSIAGDTYIYLNSDYVANISSISCAENSAIASGCIICGSEEQATTVPSHTCKGASYNRYYVTYNGNGATGGSTSTTTHMYENATTYDGVAISRSTSLAQNGFSKTGYVFIGWNTEPNGNGTSFSNGQEIKNLTATDGETITLYAQWVKDNYNLTVDPNSGVWNGSTEAQSFNVAYNGTKEISVPTKEGYDFTNWTLTGNGSTMTSLTSNSTFTMGAGDATLTANWKPIEYNVVYDGNGATSGNTNNSSHIYDQNKNLTQNGYKRIYNVTFNYNGNGQANTVQEAKATFNGWATSSNGLVSFSDKQNVINLRNTTGTYNLFANWTLANVILPNATRTGFNALGWSTLANAQNAAYNIGQAYIPTKDTTLYMVWEPYSLKANVKVKDEETGNIISSDSVIDVYEWNKSTMTYNKISSLTKQSDNSYATDDFLKYTDKNEGKFRLIQTTTPNGYYGDWSDDTKTAKKTYDFNILTTIENQTVNDKGTINIEINQKRQKAKIDADLIDSQTKTNIPQGDATLENAIYGLYAKEDIVHSDGVTGILYNAGDLVQTQVIQNGKLAFSNLELGNYEIKAIKESEGYLLDETSYSMPLTYKGENYSLIEETQTLQETVKKQAFQIYKVGGTEDDTTHTPLAGAGFKVYLISELSKVKSGEITPDSNGNFNTDDFIGYDFTNELTAMDFSNNEAGERIAEQFTDSNGKLVSNELAYGQYIVYESTIPAEHLGTNPFLVTINKDSRTPQDLRTILDRDFSVRIKVTKKDFSTQKTVLKENAMYRIWSKTTNSYIEQLQGATVYGTEEHPFVTNADGYFITPLELTFGEYELQEIKAPTGYVRTGMEGTYTQGVESHLPKENVTFTISQHSTYTLDAATGYYVLNVNQYNEAQVGSLKVSTVGEYLTGVTSSENGISPIYQEKNIPNVKVEIYASEDIKSADGQNSIIYEKGTKVAEGYTDSEGKIYFDNVPLGKYKVKETEVPEGFVLNTNTQEVTFSAESDENFVVKKDMTFKNNRPKVNTVTDKKDKFTRKENDISKRLCVVKQAMQSVYEAGEKIVYTIEVTNNGSTNINNIIVKDSMNGNFVGIDNSSKKIDEFMTVTPIDESSVSINRLLPNESVILQYEYEIPKNTAIGTSLENIATATGKVTQTVEDENGNLKEEDITLSDSDNSSILVSTHTEDKFIGIIKRDIDTKEGIKGAVIGVYAKEDVKGSDGNVIISAGTLIEKVTTDDEGKARFETDLPLGIYEIKEIEAPKGYMPTSEIITIDASYRGEDVSNIYVSKTLLNSSYYAYILKTDVNGERLAGAKLRLLDDQKNVIDEWITSTNEIHKVLKLTPNLVYTLEEVSPASGYATAEPIRFYLDTDGKIYQKVDDENDTEVSFVNMKDDELKVAIDVVEKDSNKPLTEGKITIINKETNDVVYEENLNGDTNNISKIPTGNYEIKITEVGKDGYIEKTQDIVVSDTKETQKTTVEVDYTKLQFKYIDEETKERLKDATLEIVNENGKVITFFITTDSSDFSIDKIPAGKYTLKEVISAEGYEKTEDIAIEVKNSSELQNYTILKSRLVFDLEIEKYVSRVLVDGKEVVNNAYSDKDNLVKIEVPQSKIKTQDIKVIYSIRVNNIGEVDGTVGKIIDKIPDGLSFVATDNPDWSEENGNIIYEKCKNMTIKPNSYAEINIILRWNNSEENFNEKTNQVSMFDLSNKYNFNEKDSNNNEAKANIVFAVKTGKDNSLISLPALTSIVYVMIGIITLCSLAAILILFRTFLNPS